MHRLGPGYINNDLYLERKYAGMFVRGHYMFRETKSFPRAKLEENCEPGVQRQISQHVFVPNGAVLCVLSFKYFFATRVI